jgi:hypothetical protein
MVSSLFGFNQRDKLFLIAQKKQGERKEKERQRS